MISLDDKRSKYLPGLPGASAVTIKMLANSTSGYADYVYQPAVLNGIYADPFRQWTAAELIKVGTSAPLTFQPGTNWAYSHTNYAMLADSATPSPDLRRGQPAVPGRSQHHLRQRPPARRPGYLRRPANVGHC